MSEKLYHGPADKTKNRKPWEPKDRSNLNLPETKECIVCLQTFPHTFFYLNNIRPDGLETRCKKCHNDHHKESLRKKGQERKFKNALASVLLENDGEKLIELANSLVTKAIKGDVRAADLVVNRFDGKLVETHKIEMSKEDSEMIGAATALLEAKRKENLEKETVRLEDLENQVTIN